MAEHSLLLIDDDTELTELLSDYFKAEGFAVSVANDGPSGLDRALAEDFALIVLDVMLPGMNGLEVLRRLRAQKKTPVLMLTARGEDIDRIVGLEIGADDYLPKPFDLDELLARLRAMVRRATYQEPEVIEVGDLVVDVGARLVRRGEVEVDLSAREFDILRLLAARAGRVVTRYTILDEVWDGEADLRSNVIDVHLASIRSKIDKPFDTHTITTVRGVGYRLEAPSR